MAHTQSHQWRGKPRCSRISRRNDQETESKVCIMSTLNSSAGVQRAWRSLAERCTIQKLSRIALPWRKAPWDGCTTLSSFGARWFASTFVISFPTTWIREMGR
jgi:hypothetical protein